MALRPKIDYKHQIELIFKALHVEPTREYVFHETRKWRIDWAFPDRKIAVEYEGMPFKVKKSRHTTIDGFTKDAEKYNELALAGWRLLRFNAKSIMAGLAHNHITRIFACSK